MSFLCAVADLSLTDGVRSADIRRKLGVEPLLLHVKRSQFGWFGNLITMPPERLLLEVFQTRLTKRRPQSRARTHCRDYVSHLAWEHLRIPQEECESVGWSEGHLE